MNNILSQIREYCNKIESSIVCEQEACANCSRNGHKHCPKWYSREILDAVKTIEYSHSRITDIYNESLSKRNIQPHEVIKLEKVTSDRYDELSKDSNDFLRKKQLNEMTCIINASTVVVGDSNNDSVVKEDKNDR